MSRAGTSRAARGPGEHPQLLLGEWACLGVLAGGPVHGFAVAARLRPDGDFGRIWSLSRPLTYRALDQLARRGLVEPVAQEPGAAGGPRTILAITRRGRAELRRWLGTPVAHVRDVRSELLLKLAIAAACRADTSAMLRRQRELVERIAQPLADQVERGGDTAPALDVATLWRYESSQAVLRFVDHLLGASPARAV